MRLFLHIGTHKTGTTAVQHFLTANRERLREQGVIYPLAGRPPRDAIAHGQHVLAWAITRPAPQREAVWDELREELASSDAETAVISSEEFDVLREPQQFEQLKSNLEGLDPRFVVYLRRQDEFLHSYYCTDVLFHKEAREFHDYRGTLKTEADYLRLLEPWDRTFGRAALAVRTYERPTLRDGDIVADICAEAGIDPSGLVRPPRQRQVNRAYPRNVINCVLEARRAGMPEEGIVSLRSVLKSVYKDRPSATDYLSPAEREQLLREYRESNRAVARRYLDREALFASLGVGDQAEWERRYGGKLADLQISIEDARKAFGRVADGSSAGARPPRLRNTNEPREAGR